MVCGMTPSSAATIKMTMSVTCTTRRIWVNAAAWRVDEGDLLAVALDLIRTDVLGDAAGLTVGDVGVPDAVEQQRLAVVDMTHHGDHRRPQRRRRRLVVDDEQLLEFDLLLLARIDQTDLAPISAANSSIMSSLSDWVAVTISPACMRNRTTSAAVLSFGPRSSAVEARSTTTSPSGTGASTGV